MKFIVHQKGLHLSRVGAIADTSGATLGNQRLKTPLCLLYTQGGNVPHLTHDVLQILTKEKYPAMLPLPSTVNFKRSMMSFPHGIGKFVGLDDYPIYCSIQDPAIETRPGFNDSTTISFWANSGRVQLNVDRFMEIIECYKPSWFQALCDSDTTNGSSKKRVSHAVSRSLEMLDACLLKKSQSDVLKSKGIFGSIQGGYILDARRYSAQQTAERPVDGFVIEGFHKSGSLCESLDFTDIKQLVEEVVSILPPDKPRTMHGAYRPDFVLKAVECGIDIFDASLPFIVTERGCALCFDFNLGDVKNDPLVYNKLEIDVKDTVYATDFKPILEGCMCYTCKNFTRAYINHLLLTSELLSGVLLMMHNIHHFLEFFKAIRTAISYNQWQNLKEKVLKCTNS